MKYEFELTLVCSAKSEKNTHDVRSIDTVKGDNLTSLLGQFLIVIAGVHRRILEDWKIENRVESDDDIPF